jgi:hypothetical protein
MSVCSYQTNWCTEHGVIKRIEHTYPTSQLIQDIEVFKDAWFQYSIRLHTSDVVRFCCTQCFHEGLQLLLHMLHNIRGY